MLPNTGSTGRALAWAASGTQEGAWAEELYLDSVDALQAVTDADLGEMAPAVERISAEDILEDVYARLQSRSLPLVDAAYRK